MPATVIVNEKFGDSPGTKADKTSGTVRFKTAPNADVDNANPIQIPPSGQNYSFEKWLLMEVTVAPEEEITNLEAYSDGVNNLGVGRKLWYAAVAAYVTPVIPSAANDPPQHAATPMADLFLTDSETGILLGAGPFTAIGDIGDHLVLVGEVEAGAESGLGGSEVLTIAWLEI